MTYEKADLHNSIMGDRDLSGWRPSRAELRRRRRRRNRGRWFIGGLVMLLLLAVLIPYGYYRSQVGGGSSKISVSVSASPGEGLGQFAGVLASKGVIGSSLMFRIWLRTQSPVVLQAGTYKFKRDDPYSHILATLEKGPVLDRLVIPDGLTLAQIAAKVGKLPHHSAAHFLQVASSGQVRSPFEPSSVNSLEGLLYPDTYSFDPSTSDKNILQMMVDAFVTQAFKLGLTPQTKSGTLSAYQIVILASIVEKEAIYPGDANKVARVILNRLSRNMKLQLDSTVFYALGNTSTRLSLADLQVKSPYNTYLITGLPPTPISLPSESALQAALNPASGSWLYYVVVEKNGAEAFSTTYAGQLANEKLASSRGLG
ncbi:MAG: endolytic transglycosylase MltG [Actinomycetota bacterium]|nr:MAG: endolytic transglycosylase MltG [Actinomycetota bacterium]